jgi:hypothetical protein
MRENLERICIRPGLQGGQIWKKTRLIRPLPKELNEVLMYLSHIVGFHPNNLVIGRNVEGCFWGHYMAAHN